MSKKRVLQIVGGGMNRAGAETWLMQILQHIDRNRFAVDFLVHIEGPCDYDDEIRALDSRIFVSPPRIKLFSYIKYLRHVFRYEGPFDVVHSHMGHFDGLVLRIAKQEGVNIRISHLHTNRLLLETKENFLQKVFVLLTKTWIEKYATAILAVSYDAGISLYGLDWSKDSRSKVLPCSIDLECFDVSDIDREEVRRELGIGEKTFVVGHVGRFYPPKNHTFFLKIAGELIKIEPNSCFVFVGDGPLFDSVKGLAERTQLSDKCFFLGSRSDVPRLLLGAIDVFLLPSHREGVPLVLMETQAAGLPCVCSDVVTKDAFVVKELIRKVSLEQSARVWAQTVLEARKIEFPRLKALSMMKQSVFNIGLSINNLELLYSTPSAVADCGRD
jgi:glycosyltransferase involved in cell wall biosynthesis